MHVPYSVIKIYCGFSLHVLNVPLNYASNKKQCFLFCIK